MFRDAGRRHADGLPHGVVVRGPPTAAAAGRRPGRVTLPDDLDAARPGGGRGRGRSPRWSRPATRPIARGRPRAGRRRRPGGSWTAGAGGSPTARGGRAIAVEPSGRVVGLVCFTQAVVQRTLPAPPGKLPIRERLPHGRPHARADPAAGRTSRPSSRTPTAGARASPPALLALAEEAMRAEGYREVQLWTPREAPARRFYEASGLAPRRARAVARRAGAADRGVRQAAVSLRVYLGAFGDPGHAFPMLALGEALVAAGTPWRCRPGGAGRSPRSRPG